MWTRYPIGQLITAAMERKGITRHELVGLLGYTNMTKGLRKVDAVIKGEDMDEMMLERIGKALEISPDQMKAAADATRTKQVWGRIESIIPKIRR